MEIIHNAGSIKTRQEEENRDAAIANAASMIDYLCILEGVPTKDDTTAATEGGLDNE